MMRRGEGLNMPSEADEADPSRQEPVHPISGTGRGPQNPTGNQGFHARLIVRIYVNLQAVKWVLVNQAAKSPGGHQMSIFLAYLH